MYTLRQKRLLTSPNLLDILRELGNIDYGYLPLVFLLFIGVIAGGCVFYNRYYETLGFGKIFCHLIFYLRVGYSEPTCYFFGLLMEFLTQREGGYNLR
ncbi:MAG: hypothetical protein ACOC6G_00895 [Thermoproteota archaeon]